MNYGIRVVLYCVWLGFAVLAVDAWLGGDVIRGAVFAAASFIAIGVEWAAARLDAAEVFDAPTPAHLDVRRSHTRHDHGRRRDAEAIMSAAGPADDRNVRIATISVIEAAPTAVPAHSRCPLFTSPARSRRPA